ncbi:MAG: sulfotransferase [Sphingobium sp.]
MTSEKIRITDLADPVRSEEQLQVLATAAANPVTFDSDLILATARERTGLHDFGNDGFRPRLDAWVASANADSGLSAAGRATVWNEMARFASTRLRVEDFIARHPEILDHEIETPLVVAGLPRSGTTFLLQVLAGDRRLRSLPFWEAVRPVAEPFVENGVDTRFDLCAAEWARADALLPLGKAIHGFEPEHISEDVELQCIDFGSYYLEWISRAPVWRDYYLSHDHRPVYRYMRRMFQLLSWQRGPSRWVTKCPQHMEQLCAVSDALPGSTLVITHRDPVASIQSAITGQAYRARLARKVVDVKEISGFWIDRYQMLLRRCVEDYDKIDLSQVHDVYFHELMADPMPVLEGVLTKAGLAFDADAQADMASALVANPRGKHGQLAYDLRGDFGLDPAEIRRKFDFYFDRFPDVRIEVQ